MSERYFFDTSAFSAFLGNETNGPAVAELLEGLNRSQKFTSVLVAYELYRGVPLLASKRKRQIQTLDTLLSTFTLKAVYEAHAMTGARLHRYSAGAIDPILAAQCLDGGYTMVTVNVKHFKNVPGLRLYNFTDEG